MNYSSINEAYDLQDHIDIDYNIISDDLNIYNYNVDFYNSNNSNNTINTINTNLNINNSINSINTNDTNLNINNSNNTINSINTNDTINTNDDNNNNDNRNIDAKKLLKDYKTLIKILNENKIKSINLDKKKEDIINGSINYSQKILIGSFFVLISNSQYSFMINVSIDCLLSFKYQFILIE
jgi:hypothetical protein